MAEINTFKIFIKLDLQAIHYLMQEYFCKMYLFLFFISKLLQNIPSLKLKKKMLKEYEHNNIHTY